MHVLSSVTAFTHFSVDHIQLVSINYCVRKKYLFVLRRNGSSPKL